MATRRNARKLRLQSLEARECMAGNVTAVINAGILVSLTGDNSANQVSLVSNGSGYNLAGMGTTINGSNSVRSVNGISPNLTINMNKGDDYVLIANARIGQDLTINLGDGDDTLILQNVNIGRNAAITAGNGNDTLSIQSVDVGTNTTGTNGNLNITTGAGRDSVTLVSLSIRRQLFADLGDGDLDYLTVSNSKSNSSDLRGGAGKNDRLVKVASSLGSPSVTSGFEIKA